MSVCVCRSPSSSLSTACTLVVVVVVGVATVTAAEGICMIGVDGRGVWVRGVTLEMVLG